VLSAQPACWLWHSTQPHAVLVGLLLQTLLTFLPPIVVDALTGTTTFLQHPVCVLHCAGNIKTSTQPKCVSVHVFQSKCGCDRAVPAACLRMARRKLVRAGWHAPEYACPWNSPGSMAQGNNVRCAGTANAEVESRRQLCAHPKCTTLLDIKVSCLLTDTRAVPQAPCDALDCRVQGTRLQHSLLC
jgi:hypothetical protein